MWVGDFGPFNSGKVVGDTFLFVFVESARIAAVLGDPGVSGKAVGSIFLPVFAAVTGLWVAPGMSGKAVGGQLLSNLLWASDFGLLLACFETHFEGGA